MTYDLIHGENEVILGKYNLNREELVGFADDMAKALQEKSNLENELVSVKSQYKSKIDGLEAKICKNSSIYRSGYDYREMECMVELNFETKRRYYYRLDTGEFITDEALKEDDYQLKLDLDAKEMSEKA